MHLAHRPQHLPSLLCPQGSPIYAPKAVRFRIGGLPCFAPSGEPGPLAALAPAAQRDLRAAPPAPLPPEVGPAGQQHPAAPGGTQPQAQVQQVSGVEQPLQQPGQQQASPGPPWVWESPEYEIRSLDELQRFPIPPTLCIGGYLRVELLGKRQRQAADDQFYGERPWAGRCADEGS